MTPKVALETVFKNLFNPADSDSTATEASFKDLLQSFDANTSEVGNFVAALKSLFTVSVENPTDDEKILMTTQLDAFNTAQKNLIKSFQGLNKMDFAFSFDSRNADFNKKRAHFSADVKALKLNPAGTQAFFADELTAKNIVDVIFAAIDVSNRIKSEA
jgi:hypothetical protein